ncbi:DNA alkylation repair protein [Paenibacillus senegalensis]|uniref:DNA alkylation repair protein n=1 Tax=Paenibacillus senegalensis TaxID=1465766 RepID=UPI0002880E73|nr:DNA alkylation repair protein [Paenibacillus senegalensis]
MSGSASALKYYFGKELAVRLSEEISVLEPDFPSQHFIQEVQSRVDGLELKARVAVIAEQLRRTLPKDYSAAVRLLLKLLGPENESEQGMFTNGYFLMPVAYFVERYGLDHFELSMHAIYEITKRHTSEYAIRPYLTAYPQQSLNKLQQWAKDDNSHVRRLVSEGTRPRLPWAKRMPVILGDPNIHLSLLDVLLDDSSFYVRKSVANHLNDLSKDYPDITLDWLAARIRPNENPADSTKTGTGKEKNSLWVARHALRTLIKSGDPGASRWLASVSGE